MSTVVGTPPSRRSPAGIAQSILPSLITAAHELVRSGSYDRVVMGSRRMLSIYRLMLENGLPPLEPHRVLSARHMMSTDLTFLNSKRVLLVDDTVSTGTTLRHHIERIRIAVGSSGNVKTLVGYVQREFATPELLAEVVDNSLFRSVICSASTLESVHSTVASDLYANAGPTACDPIAVGPIRTTWAGLDRIRRSSDWEWFDVTALAQSHSTSFSVYPAATVDRRIRRTGAERAMAMASAPRIRVFAAPVSDELVDLHLLAIGCTSGASTSELLRCLTDIAELHNCNSPLFRWRLWDPTTAATLVRSYIATCLLTEFWDGLDDEIEFPALDHAVLDQVGLHPYLGRHSHVANKLFDEVVRGYRRLEEQPFSPQRVVQSPHRTRQSTVATALAFNQPAIKSNTGEAEKGLSPEIFRSLYAVFRDLAVSKPDLSPNGRTPAWWTSEPGPTIDELGGTFGDDSEPATSKAVSQGIDILTDLGVVIPTTHCVEPSSPSDIRADWMVYRSYRSGENVRYLEDAVNRSDFGRIEAPLQLVKQIRDTPAGAENAHVYHDLVRQFLTLTLTPHIIRLRNEQSINAGRKRVDLIGENVASSGFFHWIGTHFGPAPYLYVECKNISTDPGNPEIDQLLGRFSQQRGRFGLLMCRTVDDWPTVISRCRDAFLDGNGLVVPVTDDDLGVIAASWHPSERFDCLAERVRTITLG